MSRISRDLTKLSQEEIQNLDVSNVASYNVEALKNYIIPSGFDLDKVDEDGMTLLHYCCERGFKTHVFHLLKNGVDKNIADNSGKKPIDYVNVDHPKQYARSKHRAIYKMLVD